MTVDLVVVLLGGGGGAVAGDELLHLAAGVGLGVALELLDDAVGHDEGGVIGEQDAGVLAAVTGDLAEPGSDVLLGHDSLRMAWAGGFVVPACRLI